MARPKRHPMKPLFAPAVMINLIALGNTWLSSASTTSLLPVANSTMTDSMPDVNFETDLQLPVGTPEVVRGQAALR